MADVRGAGVYSGQGGVFLDSAKPFSGIIADTLKKAPPAPRKAAATCSTGDSRHCEVWGHAAKPHHYQGSMPRAGRSFQENCIPGYRGHIAGKVSENVHGQTFGTENLRATQTLPLRQMRRTISAPDLITANRSAEGTRGLSVAPRVPGYAGTIPGKQSETVHALRFAESCEAAKRLREHNPVVTCDGWLRRGEYPVDRMATYKWNCRFLRADSGALFTNAQEQETMEMNRRLGQTFGLNPPRMAKHKPGDRYLHSLSRKAHHEDARLDPALQPPAGHPSASVQLDHQRWLIHNALVLKNGNQREY